MIQRTLARMGVSAAVGGLALLSHSTLLAVLVLLVCLWMFVGQLRDRPR